jgi:hypothetical protein
MTATVITWIEEVLAALESEGVRYLVVGGVAVVLHGHLRTTADLDLVVDLEPANARRAMDALDRLGFRPRVPVPAASFADPVQRERWIREKGMMVFALWHPARPASTVDVFVRAPFDFAAVHRRAVRVRLDLAEVAVASLDDLIAMKRRAGRPVDLADCEALEELRRMPPPAENPGDA